MDFIHDIYNLFWGDLFTIPLPGGNTIGISLLVLILIPSGIFFSVKTKLLPIRMFKELVMKLLLQLLLKQHLHNYISKKILCMVDIEVDLLVIFISSLLRVKNVTV